MNKSIITTIILAFASLIFSAATIGTAAERYGDNLKKNSSNPTSSESKFHSRSFERISKIKIYRDQPNFSEIASKLRLDIERGTREYVYCFATPKEMEKLSHSGIAYEVEYLDYRDETAWIHELLDLGEYHTPGEAAFFLDSIATAYPNITHLDTIGYSVEGRVIQAIIITDNPGIEEDEPEVRIAGAHHGNEPISVEIPLYLVDYLTAGYSLNPQITSLVNETEIWIIPMVNPDGIHYNSRYNAHGYDLNRDYLCPEEDLCPLGCNHSNSFSEPETQAMRSTHENNRFVLSLSMHSSSSSALICWVWGYDDILSPNGQYHATEDDDLLVDICGTYADLNTTPGFYIINGCDWYATHGIDDDYAYNFWGDIGCTVEISAVLAPPQGQIERYWLDNKEALIYYISTANTGIRGIVRDSSTNEPLDVNVKVLGPGRAVYTDTLIGDYHRPLLPGTYGMRYELPGYISQHVYGITVNEGQATRVDVFLQPSQQVVITLDVVDSIYGGNIPSQIKLSGVSFDTAFHYNGLSCTLYVPADIYLTEVYSEGYAAYFDPLDAAESGSFEISLVQFSDTIFVDNFESGLGNWFFGGAGNQWGIYSPGYVSPNCLADSPQGNYYPNANTYMESYNQPSFQNCDRAGIHYKIKYDIEYHYDMVVLEYSANWGPWFNLGDTLTGSSNGLWEYHYADLDYFCIEDVSSLRWGFRLASNNGMQYDGIYIDDIFIGGLEAPVNIDDNSNLIPYSFKLNQNYPNPFNSSTVIKYALSEVSNVTIDIYDVLGRKVETLINTKQQADYHQIVWNADGFSSGVYFYNISAGEITETKKMVLLK